LNLDRHKTCFEKDALYVKNERITRGDPFQIISEFKLTNHVINDSSIMYQRALIFIVYKPGSLLLSYFF